MSTLPLLNYSALDADGDSIPGAKLYFYESGGSVTPLDTYSDEDLSVANANPVVADANGRFDRIFLKTDDEYRVVFTDASDVTIWTEDNVKANQLTSAGLAVTLKKVASNPVDYGAVGDGVADESSEVQSAIDNATGTVDLLGLTFRCDSAISLDSGITLRNGTLDFTNCTDDEYVLVQGSRGSWVNLSSDATAGDETVDLDSVSGLTSGDLLYVAADSAFNVSGDYVGEIVRIKSIAGTTITLSEPIFDSYATAVSASAQKLTTKNKVVIEDVVIDCAVGASGGGMAVVFDVCNDVTCRNVTINTPKGAGIRIMGSNDVKVHACVVVGSTNVGVGFDSRDHSRNVTITDSTVYLMSIGYRTGDTSAAERYGVTAMIDIRQCASLGCTTGFKTESNCRYSSLEGWVTYPSGGTTSSTSTNAIGTNIIGIRDISSGNYVGMTATGGGTGAGMQGNAISGTGLLGYSQSGYGVTAEADTSSPTKSSLHLVPQDDDPSSGANGNIYVTEGGKIQAYAGQWDRVRQISYSMTAPEAHSGLFGDFSSKYTIPANTLRPGSVVRMFASGYHSAGTSGGATSITPKFDNNSLPMPTVPHNSGRVHFVEAVVVVRDATTAVMYVVGGGGLPGFTSLETNNTAATPLTIDITQGIDVEIAYAVPGNGAGDVLSLEIFVVEVSG